MSATALDALRQRYRRGARLKYLFFWQVDRKRAASLDPSCLSQWWRSPFTVDGNPFSSAEQYMMYRKAVLFGDRSTAEQILTASSARQIKQLGRNARDFDQSTWDREKFAIVREANAHKFEQNKDLKDFLKGTGSKILVEASPVDRVWGIGLAEDDKRAKNPLLWRGENLLGFALMDVRDDL